MRDALGLGHISAATAGRAATDGGSVSLGRRPAGEVRQVSARGTPRVTRLLIIVQNLPVPFDRRVWLECQALTSAGYQVAVVCPKGSGEPAHEVIDSVELYRYRPYAPGGSKVSFIAEYVYSFLATARGALKARRSGRFAVIQACNPPDIFWPLALAFRVFEGTRFVFDHHDLCPELYQSRFPHGPKLPFKGLLALERRTHRAADHVIATNDSYREIAMTRGGKRPNEVTVVRTGPDLRRLQPGEADPELRRGRRFLVAYIGVMGPQDGVDIVVRAADIVVNKLGRDDITFTLIGSGDCFDDLVALRDALGLPGHVEFTGRAPDELVARIMSTADAGLSPDPKNPLNDVSTMNKTMEYMAFGLPVIAFDLRETRVSAGNAAVYVQPNDEHKYAEAIVALMDDEPRRALMGKLARERVEQELAWNHQESAYLGVYERVLSEGKALKRMTV
jgi:glycosyltransferase involved in cell wall biosynthesis